jgi:hypothetical protein
MCRRPSRTRVAEDGLAQLTNFQRKRSILEGLLHLAPPANVATPWGRHVQESYFTSPQAVLDAGPPS